MRGYILSLGLLLFLLLGIAACRPNLPPIRGGPPFPDTVRIPPDEPTTLAAAVAHATFRWQHQRVTAYLLRVQISDGTRALRVYLNVVDNEPTWVRISCADAVECAAPEQQLADWGLRVADLTVLGLSRQVHQLAASATEAQPIAVQFDPDWGFVRSFAMERPDALDGRLQVTVEWFAPLRRVPAPTPTIAFPQA